MNENDKKALNRITKQAAKVTQSELTYIDDLYCNIATKKFECIMANRQTDRQTYLFDQMYK